jgi:hypothetical protein
MELFHSVPPWNMEYHGIDSYVEGVLKIRRTLSRNTS